MPLNATSGRIFFEFFCRLYHLYGMHRFFYLGLVRSVGSSDCLSSARPIEEFGSTSQPRWVLKKVSAPEIISSHGRNAGIFSFSYLLDFRLYSHRIYPKSCDFLFNFESLPEITSKIFTHMK